MIRSVWLPATVRPPVLQQAGLALILLLSACGGSDAEGKPADTMGTDDTPRSTEGKPYVGTVTWKQGTWQGTGNGLKATATVEFPFAKKLTSWTSYTAQGSVAVNVTSPDCKPLDLTMPILSDEAFSRLTVYAARAEEPANYRFLLDTELVNVELECEDDQGAFMRPLSVTAEIECADELTDVNSLSGSDNSKCTGIAEVNWHFTRGGSSGPGSDDDDESGDAGSGRDAGASDDASAASDASAANDAGSANDAGAVGDAGDGGGGTANARPLPDGTLLYIRHATKDHDLLVAHDFETGGERIVTDLTGDGSSGWEIGGFALSPDRRRIALASLYGPTKDDTATGLATRAIWTLSVDGTDFRRLTPTFPKDAQGRQGFQYEVGEPEFSADGTQVLYGFGEYWWEGTSLKGGSFPWIVATSGKTPPTSFATPTDCSVLYPSRNPVTGEFVFLHSVCVPGQGEGDGVYLYPANGGKSPKKLIDSARTNGSVDVFLGKPAWFSDASGFLFLGGTAETDWRPSLLAYDAADGAVSVLVPAAVGTGIQRVAVSPDSSKVVYCVRTDDGLEDLHLIDVSVDPPTDAPLTTDGKSCDPSF